MDMEDGKGRLTSRALGADPCREARRVSDSSALVLGAAEGNLVRACRRFAEGPAAWALVPQQIWLVCGLASIETVLETTECFMRLLLGASRRGLDIRPAESESVSADEVALVALIAAAQTNHHAHVDAITRWLVIPPAQAALGKRAEALGRAFAAAGLELRRRRPPEPPILLFKDSA